MVVSEKKIDGFEHMGIGAFGDPKCVGFNFDLMLFCLLIMTNHNKEIDCPKCYELFSSLYLSGHNVLLHFSHLQSSV